MGTRPGFVGNRSWVLGALLAGCIPLAASAQTWEVFDSGNAGFLSNNVSDVAVTSTGVVWVGTSFGLNRYENGTWQGLLTDNSGVPDNVIKCLATDAEDRLWVGTQLNGIGIFDGTSWSYLNAENSPLPDNEINRITIDHRGWAWIGTYLGLVCRTETAWYLYNDSDTSHAGLRMNGNVVQDVQVRDDGLVAIGTLNGGMHYLTDTSMLVLNTFEDNFPDNSQNAVVFDAEANERWIATPSQGLVRHGGEWYNGPWFSYTTLNSSIPSNAATCLLVRPGSEVWFGTLQAGLGIRYPSGAYMVYNATNSDLPGNNITRVLGAPDGSFWVGTGYNGAARLTLPSGLPDQALQATAVFPNPSAGQVELVMKRAGAACQWWLTDAEGRLLRIGRTEGQSTPLDLQSLANGVYHLGLDLGAERAVHRLIIQH